MDIRSGSWVLPSVLSLLVVPSAWGRDLSFEGRLRAQEAIERVYYSHQIGASQPFEQAVPRQVLEGRVRAYLKKSAALEKFWKTPVTSEMLLSEWERMARETRLPERLAELSRALGDDPFLFQETVARPALVDRLVRSFFAQDASAHAAARRKIAALRARVLSGELQPYSSHRMRKVIELIREGPEDGPGDSSEAIDPTGVAKDQRSVSPERFEELRALLPGRTGDVGPVKEGLSALAFSTILEQDSERLRVAIYTVPKRSFDDWFSSIQDELDDRAVRAVARIDTPRPPAAAAGADWSPAPGLLSTSDLEHLKLNSSCAEDTWDSGALASVPEGREYVTAVWTGSLMIVWGGTNFTDAVQFNTGGRYDPATDTWTATSIVNAPSARYRHTAVWTGSSMIVWGGTGPTSSFLDTGGRYDPATDIWSTTSLTDAPSGRYNHTAVWTGSSMIIWGGFALTSPTTAREVNTGSGYNPVSDTWSSLATLGTPEARQWHTAIWTGSRMIVWGGGVIVFLPGGGFTYQYFNSGGAYDPATDAWAPISTANAPSARWQHSSVWTGDLVLVWGGYGSTVDPAGGRYDPRRDIWTAMSGMNAPTGAIKHVAVWTGSLLVVWGGNTPSGGSFGTGGRYDPSTDAWTPTSMTNAPARREGHAAVWTGTQVLLWGGRTGEVSQNSGGRYDPVADTWTPTSLGDAPPARAGHPAVWTGTAMIVWGGAALGPFGVTSPINTGGLYDPALDLWTPTGTTNAPEARQYHTAIWTGSRMVVWGGYGSTFLNSGGRYDPLTDTWAPTSLTGAPGARNLHRAVWTGQRMIIWGGNTAQGATSTGGRYDPANDVWTATSLAGAPVARMEHVAVWTGSRMIVWGGRGPLNSSSGGQYDPSHDRWTSTTVTDAPAGREGATAVWTGKQMIVWGGFANNSYLNTGGRYDPVADSWSATSLLNAPGTRWGHTAAWTGSHMVIWGGHASGPTFHRSGGRYDPETDRWSATSESGAPLGRSRHSGLWTASQMLVWGGADRFTYLNSGGRYCACMGATATYYQDADGDGLGDNSVSLPACTAPVGYVTAGSDCNDADPGSWSPPSEVTDFLFDDDTMLSWTEPARTGAPMVLYDVVRSEDPRDFLGGAACIASDIAATETTDLEQPASGPGFFYLVRAANDCPEDQTVLGTASDGTSIPGRACP